MKIEFTVNGLPKGQPRARAFAFRSKDPTARPIVRMYDPATAEGWKGQIADAVRSQVPAEPIAGPVSIECEFFFPRPKAHYRKAGLHPSAPYWHLGRPDCDNLAKAVMDALTVLQVWTDDSLVCVQKISKRYSDNPGMKCVIEEIVHLDNGIAERG